MNNYSRYFERIHIEIVVSFGWRLCEPPAIDFLNDQPIDLTRPIAHPVLLNVELGCCRSNVAEGIGSLEREGVIAAVRRIVRSTIRARDGSASAEPEAPIRINDKRSSYHVRALAVRNGVRAAREIQIGCRDAA